MGNDAGAYVRLVATSLAWGGSVVAIKYAVADVPPFTLSLLRYSIATVFFLVILATRGGRLPTLAQLPLFILAGVFGIGIWSAGVNGSLQFTGAGEAALLTSLSPVISAFLAASILKDPMTPTRFVGAGISLAGIALLIIGGPGLDAGGSNRLFGDFLALFAAVGWGGYSVIVAAVQRGGARPIETTAYSTAAGALIFLPLMFLEPNRPSLTAIPFGTWLAILYMAIISTVCAYLWWNEGVRRIGATRASLFSHMANVNSVIFSALLLGERLAPLQLFGGLLVIAGLFVANRTSRAPADLKAATS